MNGMEKVIAVDFDDTISYTNLAICKWHNEKYGTTLSIDDFHSYYYWKNPGFGTPKEARYKLIVITARMHQIADDSVLWLEKHFPGISDTIYFTSAFQQPPEESN